MPTVEKLPVQREWEFWQDDDVTITFSMMGNGVIIPLTDCIAFGEIRATDSITGTLVSTGVCSITNNIITAKFARTDLDAYANTTVYGELRLTTSTSDRITLLKFSAAIFSTFSRPAA